MRQKWRQFKSWISKNRGLLIDFALSFPFLKNFAPLWSSRKNVELLLDNNLPSVGRRPTDTFSVAVVNTGRAPITVKSLEMYFGNRVFERTPPSGWVFHCMEQDELVTLKPGESFKKPISKKFVWNIIKQETYKEKSIDCRLACLLVGEKNFRFSSGRRSFGIAYFES